MLGLARPLKRVEHGFRQACLRWQIYAEPLLRLMPPPAKRNQTVQVVLPRVPQVKLWLLLTSHNTLLVALTMLSKRLLQLTHLVQK